jgi:hypothetical protein
MLQHARDGDRARIDMRVDPQVLVNALNRRVVDQRQFDLQPSRLAITEERMLT